MLRASPFRLFALVACLLVASCGGQTVSGGRGDAAIDDTALADVAAADAPDDLAADGPADVAAEEPTPDVSADDPPPADAEPLDVAAPADVADEPPAPPDAPRMDVAPRDVAGLLGVRCGVPAPEGAPRALPAPRYSGGTCPRLVPGRNVLRTAGGMRAFHLVVPRGGDAGAAPMPLLFGWHWLNGSATGFIERGQVQANADRRRFIGAFPEKKGDLGIGFGSVRFDPGWPYLNFHTPARIEEEAQFFDDMLACIAAQYPVDLDCVSSAGVSAGALWTAQLAQVRSERLASAIILSGGIGPATVLGAGLIDARTWSGARHRLPMMILWGGPIDQCGLNFNVASRNLQNAVGRAGHFIEECLHNCGHTVPPVDPMYGIGAIWQFFLDHPYWLAPGDSPYLAAGLPMSAPTWCAIGAGRATPRVGSCPDPTMSCPIPAL
jgi:hypothetical protein